MLAFLVGLGLVLASKTTAGVILLLVGLVLVVLGTFGSRMEGEQQMTLKVQGQELTIKMNLAKVRQLAQKADRELEAGDVTSLEEVE